MNALPGLAHEAVSSGQAVGDFLPAELKLKDGSDGIAVASGSGEFKGDPVRSVGVAELVFDKAESRPFAVGLPKIEVSILIPVCGNDRSPVVDEIESAHCGNVGEALEGAIGRAEV